MQDTFLQKLLEYYGYDLEGYRVLTREPSFSSLPALEDLENLNTIRARLQAAKRKGEKVIIYGDYDTDGIMSTSIIKLMLEAVGIPATTYVPSRYLDGYGINLKNAEKIAANGFSLVITVDNGVAKLDEFFTNADSFTPPTEVAGALKNSMLEKSIVLAVTENFVDADNTSYGSAT